MHGSGQILLVDSVPMCSCEEGLTVAMQGHAAYHRGALYGCRLEQGGQY